MVKRPKSPDVAEEGRYFTVYQPYPLNADWFIESEQIRCAQWIAECIGPKHVLVIYHKPKASLYSVCLFAHPVLTSYQARGMILLEVTKSFTDHGRLLGEHRWREMLKDPSHEEKQSVSQVFYSFYTTSREAQKDGWKAIHVQNQWFKDWQAGQGEIVQPYPDTVWCSVPVEDRTNKPLCRPIPREQKAPPPRNHLPVVGSEEWVEKHSAVRDPATYDAWATATSGTEMHEKLPSLTVVTAKPMNVSRSAAASRRSPDSGSSADDSGTPASATDRKTKVAWGKPVPLKQFNAPQKSAKSSWAPIPSPAPPGAKSPLLEEEPRGPVNAWVKPLKIPPSEKPATSPNSDSPWSAAAVASPWDPPTSSATPLPELGSEKAPQVVDSQKTDDEHGSKESKNSQAPWGSKANKLRNSTQTQSAPEMHAPTRGTASQQAHEKKKWAEEVEDEYFQATPDNRFSRGVLYDAEEKDEDEEDLDDLSSEILDPWETAVAVPGRSTSVSSGLRSDRSGNPSNQDAWDMISTDPDDLDMQLEENLWIDELPSEKPPELICPTHKTSRCKKGICRDMAKLVREHEKKQQMEEKKKGGGRAGRGGRGGAKWKGKGRQSENSNGRQTTED